MVSQNIKGGIPAMKGFGLLNSGDITTYAIHGITPKTIARSFFLFDPLDHAPLVSIFINYNTMSDIKILLCDNGGITNLNYIDSIKCRLIECLRVFDLRIYPRL